MVEQRQVGALYGLEVRIRPYKKDSPEYVQALWENKDRLPLYLGELGPEEKRFLEGKVATLYERGIRDSNSIRKKEFVLTGVDPSSLLDIRDFETFIKTLMRNHELDLTNFSIDGLELNLSAYDGDPLLIEVRGPYCSKNKSNYDGIVVRLRPLLEDFAELEAEFCYEFLEEVAPCLIDILHQPSHIRQTIISKILRNEYPFSDDNKREWKSEIKNLGQLL